MSGPHPEVALVRAAVRRALPAEGLLLAACSGGADSLALAAALATEATGRCGLVSVDHELQPGSRDRAERVARWGQSLGMSPAEAITVAVHPGGSGPEDAARSARRAALAEAARRHGASAVVLGHTRDDQAEQVLLGLARGSGARSLAGMRPLRVDRRAAGGRAHDGGAAAPAPPLVWLRPLLDLPRATTRAACAALGLLVWDDPHNADRAHTRVRARLDALPALEAALGPGVGAALARSARQLAADADALDELAEQAHEQCARTDGLDVAALLALPSALRSRVLLLAAQRAGARALGEVHVRGLDALVTAWHGQGPLDLPGRQRAHRSAGRIVFSSPLACAP